MDTTGIPCEMINLKKGLIRLWIVFSIPWFAYWGWEYSDARKNAKDFQETVSDYYGRMTNAYSKYEKTKHPYDLQTAQSWEKNFNENVEYRNEETVRYELASKFGPTVPLALFAFGVALLWVRNGFFAVSDKNLSTGGNNATDDPKDLLNQSTALSIKGDTRAVDAVGIEKETGKKKGLRKNLKQRILITLVTVLTVVFIFFLYKVTINSYEIGSGLSYLSELKRSGLELGASTASKAHENAAKASEIEGVQHAALTAFSYIFFFGAFLLVIGYGFSLKFLSIRRTLLLELFLTGVASLLSGGATLYLGKSGRIASQVGLGVWLATALLFAVLICIIWGVRRFIRSRQENEL
jgi:hypothetical protein